MTKKQQRNLSIGIALLVLGYIFYKIYKKNRVTQEQATNEAIETNELSVDSMGNPVSLNPRPTTTR
jgi:hypothetical protein